jgi:thymidine kinase
MDFGSVAESSHSVMLVMMTKELSMAKLYFYYSAMNAGKSTTLLQSSYNYQERGMDTLLFTPSFDNRFDNGFDEGCTITSRIGLTSGAIGFDADTNLFNYTASALKQNNRIKCVFVDEAQFLSKAQVLQLTNIADKLHIPVLAYGLRSDFRGEPFEGSKYLLAWAEELAEIKTICHCGRKATMNLRFDNQGKVVQDGAQVEIGGNERYVSVCHRHHKEAFATHVVPCTVEHI